MVNLKEKRVFLGFWRRWRQYLSSMVLANGGILLCPIDDDLYFEDWDAGYKVSLKWPICFRAIPHKGNSSKSHGLVVFIDGSFKFSFSEGVDDSSRLISVESNVAFFKAKATEEGVFLNLVDAYHFDHFVEDPVTSAPHPVFHAQRNIRPDVVFQRFDTCLNSDPENTMRLGPFDQHEKDRLFGLKTFRLPTPQVDLFSLSAIIAADHLVDKCSHDSPHYKSFKAFVRHISESKSSITNVNHQPNVYAQAARAENRFVWQWYSSH